MFEFVCKFDHINGKSWSDDSNEYKDSFIKKENKLELYPTMIGETIEEENSRINEYKVYIRMNNLNTDSHYIGRKSGKEEAQEILDKAILNIKTQAKSFEKKVISNWRSKNLDFNVAYLNKNEIMKKDENNKLRLCELSAIKEQLEFECNIFIHHNVHCAYDEVIQLWEKIVQEIIHVAQTSIINKNDV